MPRGDGTGPMGMGPMTGRGAGFCAGFASAGYANPAGFGRMGGGFGCGRGYRRMYYATGLPGWARDAGAGAALPDEKAWLTRQADMLENQLKQVKSRLSGLDESNG